MSEQLESWKSALERLKPASSADWSEAGRLAGEISRLAADGMLRHAAEQAIPILRQAAVDAGDRDVATAARRRLGVVLEVLHDLTAPKFGRRGQVPKPLSGEARARKMLGLPDGVQLTCADIHQAFRRAAKTLHPDAGGTEQAFRELAAARDVLIHPGAHKDG